MKTRLLFLLATLALPASAQVYKCKTPTGGTLVSDRPCDGPNKTVDVRRSEPVTLEQQRQAAELQQRRRQQLGQIEAEEAEYREQLAGRAALQAKQEAQEAKQKAIEDERTRQQKCYEIVTQKQKGTKLTGEERAALAACGLPVSEQNRKDQDPPPDDPPNPGIVTKCDPGGCWDTHGKRYNGSGRGNFFRQDGRSCQQIGDRMRCN